MDSGMTRDGWDRWACLGAAMVMEACGGLGYTFGVYSQHLKERLGYNQEDLDDIGAAKDIGYAFGIVGGILYNYTPPWVSICIGALMHFSGYIGVYMTSAGKIAPPFLIVCGLISFGTGGDSWVDTAAVMTSVQNFVDYRGTAIGVLKAQVGLSGAIFVTLYKAFLKPEVDGYVFMVAVAPAVASLSLAFFVRPFPKENSDSSGDGRFQLAYGATVFLGLYLLFSIFIQTWKDATRPWLIFFAVTMLIIFFFICSTLAFYRPCRRLFDSLIGHTQEYNASQEMVAQPTLKHKNSEIRYGNVRVDPEEDHYPLRDEVHDAQDTESLENALSSPLQQPTSQRQGYHMLEPEAKEASTGTFSPTKLVPPELAEIETYTLLDCLSSFNFWLLSLVAITGPGCGLAIINNFGQIARSLKSESVELFVGLISVASCFGRLIAGYSSDVLLKKTTYPRPMCLTVAHLTMSMGCFLLSAGYIPFLYLGSALVGGSYGAFWALTPAILAEVFGLQNFAALYKLIGACGPIGAYILSAKIVGQFYDEEAEVYRKSLGPLYDSDEGKDNACMGSRCFGFSMMVLAVVCIAGASLGVILSIRTRRLYAKMK